MAFGPMSVGNQATLSLLTDQTLTQVNMPADAKATGNRMRTAEQGIKSLNDRIVQYLLLSGGTITGGLTVNGGITGNLTGSATQWNNHTLTKNHATVSGSTWIPVFDANNTVNYATLDDLLQATSNRIATLESRVNAVAKTTEVFLRSLTFKAGKELCGSTVTLATMAADVAFVRFNSSSNEAKLLRGSSVYKYADIYQYSDSKWVGNRILVTFNSDGRITATDDAKLYLSTAFDQNSFSYVGTMYCYNYVST
jgi:hypothetical protein